MYFANWSGVSPVGNVVKNNIFHDNNMYAIYYYYVDEAEQVVAAVEGQTVLGAEPGAGQDLLADRLQGGVVETGDAQGGGHLLLRGLRRERGAIDRAGARCGQG